MNKNFTVTLPDEPYKTTTALNKTVECVYTGPRYLAICVIEETGEIKYLARRGDTLADIDMPTLVDDDPATEFYAIDAKEHTFEAAYLTGQYTHGNVPDFTVEHPGDLGTWSYHYDEGTGVIGQCFYGQDMKYVNSQFVAPRYREHAAKRQDVMDSCISIANTVEQSIQNNDYSDEDKQKLEEYIVWLRAVPTAYEGIDHWTIPFPSDIPTYY
jgi:hypothetical protein